MSCFHMIRQPSDHIFPVITSHAHFLHVQLQKSRLRKYLKVKLLIYISNNRSQHSTPHPILLFACHIHIINAVYYGSFNISKNAFIRLVCMKCPYALWNAIANEQRKRGEHISPEPSIPLLSTCWRQPPSSLLDTDKTYHCLPSFLLDIDSIHPLSFYHPHLPFRVYMSLYI